VLVQKVIMPTTEAESWTVTDDDLEPVQPAEEYLAHLSAIERSPTTVRAYAHSLKLWFEFVTGRGLAWDQVSVDTVARFVAWLVRRPTTSSCSTPALPCGPRQQ
jgi:integrase/recombinase XerD